MSDDPFMSHARQPPSVFWGPYYDMPAHLLATPPGTDGQVVAGLVEEHGAYLGGFIPETSWLVLGAAAELEAAAHNLGAALYEFKPEYKISSAWQPIQAALDEAASVATEQASNDAGHNNVSNSGSGGDQPDAEITATEEPPQQQGQEQVSRRQLLAMRTHAARNRVLSEHHLSGSQAGRLILIVQFPQGLTATTTLPDSAPSVNLPRAAAADWAGPLSKVVESVTAADRAATCAPQLLPLSTHLQVSTCPEALATVLAWLSDQPLVTFIEPGREQRLSNAFASMVSQTGALPQGGLVDAPSAVFHPFWRMGLDGTGQLLGVGDTGLDMQSCWFRDPAVDFWSHIQYPTQTSDDDNEPSPTFPNAGSGLASGDPTRSGSSSSGSSGSSGSSESGSNGESSSRGGAAGDDTAAGSSSGLGSGGLHSGGGDRRLQGAETSATSAKSSTGLPGSTSFSHPIFRSDTHRKVAQYIGYSSEYTLLIVRGVFNKVCRFGTGQLGACVAQMHRPGRESHM